MIFATREQRFLAEEVLEKSRVCPVHYYLSLSILVSWPWDGPDSWFQENLPGLEGFRPEKEPEPMEPLIAGSEKILARDLFVFDSCFNKLAFLDVAPSGKNWRALGDALGIQTLVLDRIRMTHGANPTKELIRYWMPTKQATVQALVQALRSIGQDQAIQVLQNLQDQKQ